ncbi:TetR/AcrR family transcriptional regulator [Actinomycetes bacterium KLBMP 9759]
MPTAPMSGRRAQAARNDELILKAARDVFVADPGAPIAAVAERAGVGISALYRRYGSKEDLLRKLCADGLAAYIAIAEAAMASDGDPWDVFAEFFRALVVADSHSLTISLAGTFEPTGELYAMARRSDELINAIVGRAQDAGVLRKDVLPTDFGMLFEQLASVRRGGDARTEELRSRYVALVLSSLRTPPQHEPLPGPAPQPGEFADRWTKKT